MTAYDFHPEARFDLDEIWEFIRADNLDAADRVIAEILAAIVTLGLFPVGATDARTSPHGLCVSFWYVNTRLPMRLMKHRCGLSQSCADGAAPRVMAATLRGRE
ncbi:MAG: type II toxin-antitoxin system RelE/ParE family toxin [Bryobacteraceae bacterium]